ncbi:hypothetical protein LCGC14_0840000 [marine sediment metagenome]|uniref:Uncharacterized protein n=1 Tax=marine sediment metagenome TaxID=412755 RepID=A0A0F9PYM5_9ZZZZ
MATRVSLNNQVVRDLTSRRRRFLRRLGEQGFDQEEIDRILDNNYLSREDVGELFHEIYEGEEESILTRS